METETAMFKHNLKPHEEFNYHKLFLSESKKKNPNVEDLRKWFKKRFNADYIPEVSYNYITFETEEDQLIFLMLCGLEKK